MMFLRDANPFGAAGFTLLETLIALSLLLVVLAGVAPVVAAAQRAGVLAQQSVVAQRAARDKLEQLQSLVWTSEVGVPVSDWSTDLSVTPPRPTGGPGLGVAPTDSLLSNHDGYCDFLAVDGRWLAGGTRPPAGAAWVRRWSISLLDDVEDTLLLQVMVIPVQLADPASSVRAARGINGAWLLDIRTRSAR